VSAAFDLGGAELAAQAAGETGNAGTPGQAAGVDPTSIAYRVHAYAFNKLTEWLATDQRFVPLSVRDDIATAVVAAVEGPIRADERERIAAREPKPAPLSALGVRSGELTVDEVQELRGKLEASLAQPAPELAAAMAETRQKLDDALDDFLFERQQVVELRTILGEIFTCLAAGDPALLDDDQVFEWRERAGLPS